MLPERWSGTDGADLLVLPESDALRISFMSGSGRASVSRGRNASESSEKNFRAPRGREAQAAASE